MSPPAVKEKKSKDAAAAAVAEPPAEQPQPTTNTTDLEAVPQHDPKELLKESLKRTLDMYTGQAVARMPTNPKATKARMRFKLKGYAGGEVAADIQKEVASLPGSTPHEAAATAGPQQPPQPKPADSEMSKMIDSMRPSGDGAGDSISNALAIRGGPNAHRSADSILSIAQRKLPPKPNWHPPWKLKRVISGHTGWVRCVAVDPSNEWFATAGNDRMIKIWDLASGTLKLTLTNHVGTIRSIQISDRHPYMFTGAEDNEVKCWDLEQNAVVRTYHGHLSGVYCTSLHPTLNILASGARDATVRVWDIRTKNAIHTMTGHTGTITSLASQAAEPQFISGSLDKMVKCWDLVAGKSYSTLTNHKKSIRSISIHPSQYAFASMAADNNKIWRCPKGNFERNISGHNAIPNCSAIRDGPEGAILVGGMDNGYLHFWDWKSGYKFQDIKGVPQPGSMSAENGVFCCAFDQSGSRLITGECDKTIKIYQEDESATQETHPLNWKAPSLISNRF